MLLQRKNKSGRGNRKYQALFFNRMVGVGRSYKVRIEQKLESEKTSRIFGSSRISGRRISKCKVLGQEYACLVAFRKS